MICFFTYFRSFKQIVILGIIGLFFLFVIVPSIFRWSTLVQRQMVFLPWGEHKTFFFQLYRVSYRFGSTFRPVHFAKMFWFGAKTFLASENFFLLALKNHSFFEFFSMSRWHLKDLGTRFFKLVLFFKIFWFKNCKIELPSGTELMGHSVNTSQ